jgi:serine/threonine protein kinase
MQGTERFQPLGLLGTGGQGRTYRALDRQTNDEVAVKEIRLRDMDGWKSFDLFERECQVLRSLSHPGIPRFIATYSAEAEGKFYLVMELIAGKSLKEISGKEILSTAQLWNIVHQVLEILQYLHSCKPRVIHRDLKPANILRRDDGSLALVDFGGVRLASHPDGGSTVVGTFGYMAPEQLHGEASPASDIYSLGATIAGMAAGMSADKLPRQGLKIDLQAAMEASPLRSLLQRMLEPDPQERLGSVNEVKSLLHTNAPRRPLGSTRRSRRTTGSRHSSGSDSNLHESSTDSTADPPARDPDLPAAAAFFATLFGSLSYLSLVVVEGVFMPLIYAVLSMFYTSTGQRKKLRQRTDTIRGALREGQQSMKRLARSNRRQKHTRRPPGSKRRDERRRLRGRGRRR